MKSFYNFYQWKKYRIDLDEATGEIIGYAVEVNARGRKPVERGLWSKSSGTPMPQRLKDVTNVRGTADTIAYVMGWQGDS
jgi:hypothetical protein